MVYPGGHAMELRMLSLAYRLLNHIVIAGVAILLAASVVGCNPGSEDGAASESAAVSEGKGNPDLFAVEG